MKKENIEGIYNLSSMQKNMIFSYAINPSTLSYIEQFDFHIHGEIDSNQMNWALNQIISKYSIFRAVFSFRNTDEPKQIILKEREAEWVVHDYRNMSVEDVDEFKNQDLKRGFDLSKDVLIRGALLKVQDNSWRFLLTFHHIIIDGWSLAPILEEFFNLYRIEDHGAHIRQTSDFSYYKYIQWIENMDSSKAQSYWHDYLLGYDKKVTIPSFNDIYKSDEEQLTEYHREIHVFKITEQLTNRIHMLARENNITANTIIQTIWGILLQKFNYTNDAVYGMVVSGRSLELDQIEDIKGLFINSVPIRITTKKEDTFIALCKMVQQNIFHTLSYEYYPLPDIQNQSELKNNLLDHIMAFENYPLSDRLQDTASEDEGRFKIQKVDVIESSDYNFNIIINPAKEYLITFIYNANVYSKNMMELIQHSLINLFEAVCQMPDILVSKLSLCSEKDNKEIINYINEFRKPYPNDMTVDGIFQKVASEYKKNVAVVFKDRKLSYEELELLSDGIKHKLIQKGITANDTVGVMTPRCAEYVIAILGILKTGASYLPFDLANSQERLEFIMGDSNINGICTLENLKERVPTRYELIILDADDESYEHSNNDICDLTIHGPDSQAYIMYTSGSTGKPKGCKISHKNIVSLVYGQEYMEFGEHQVIMQIASPAFDISALEIWASLLHGGTLVIPEEEDITDIIKLKNLIESREVNNMVFTSSLFNRICDEDPYIFCTLNTLAIGGESLSVPHIRKVMEANPKLQVINAYGPTENSSYSTTHTITAKDLIGKRIPIGKPLMNSHAYVMDLGLNILPVGAIGELCFGGDGVSSGYYNRIELTNERFIDDPLISLKKIYRTGDIVRQLPDGSYDIFGRLDSQIKIRGFRIELGEIKNTLNDLPGMNQVTVQVRELGNEKYICCYYTSSDDVDIERWKEILGFKLPSYMMPTFFIKLDTIPITANGKVDHRQLPSPRLDEIIDENEVMDAGELETIIRDICSSVLDIDSSRISLNVNFFDIGITSLNMITINNRLNKQLGKKIPLTVMFEYNTIKKLKTYLVKEQEECTELYDIEEVKLEAEKNRLLKTSKLIRRTGDVI